MEESLHSPDPIHQAPLRPAELERYRTDVRTRLHGSASAWLERPIRLSLAALPVRVLEAGALYRTSENALDALLLADALASFPHDLTAVLGEPGAGKTTLLQQQAIAALDKRSHIPIFIELSNYAPPIRVVDLALAELEASGIPRDSAKRHLKEGGFLVLLDGLNEVDEMELLDVGRETVQFHRIYGMNNQFVLTCRTAEWPATIDNYCRRYELLSVARADATDYVAGALTITPATAAIILERFEWGIQQLTHTPLLLNMLTSVLAEHGSESDVESFWTSGEGMSRLPKTRAALYQQFTRAVLIRDFTSGKTILPVELHERAIMRLARHMANSSTIIDAVDAERLLGDFCMSNRIEAYGFTIRQVQKNTLYAPPLVSTKGTIGRYSNLTFMHQSFQEYYTALDIVRRLGDETVGDALEIGALSPYFTDLRWWDTLVLVSGLLDDATPLVRLLIDTNGLHLAARCIRESKFVSLEHVDRLILAGYEQFKYSNGFDYDLIPLLRDIFDRSSQELPSRLVEDITWWSQVYAGGVPRELHHLSDSQLLVSLDSLDTGLVADGVYTCALRGLSAGCGHILGLLEKHTSQRVRDQVVIAIGKLKCSGGIEKLRSIALDPNERHRIRALALTSLSEYHEPSVVPILTGYLLNPENPFKEAAAWALSRMGDLITSEPLLQALRLQSAEADQISDNRYVLGTILYALSQLRDMSVVPFLVQWSTTIQDAFVLEDLVHALGQIGDPRGVAVVVEQLRCPDAVVRKRAIEALVRLHAGTAVDGLTVLLGDRSPFVREAAERAINTLVPGRPALTIPREKSAYDAASSPAQPGEPLTARERELVPLIMAGLTNKQIAERLVISDKTVTNHITTILAKLGLRNRTEMAKWGWDTGLQPTR